MLYADFMSGASFSISQRAGRPLQSRKAMLDTLVRHLDMIRLTVPLLAIVFAVGCVGTIGGPGTGGGDASTLTPAEAAAQADWSAKAFPAMTVCAGCHGGQVANVGFLVGANAAAARATLLAFDPQVVNTDAPQSSRILTKGLHDGPALDATSASALLEWIQLERTAVDPTGSGSTLVQTAQFQALLCSSGSAGSPTCPVNHVPLDPAGAPGATIDLVVQSLGTGIYVNQLSLVGGTAGAYIEHPLFVSYPAGAVPKPDSLDRFFATKMDEMAGMSEQIDGGTAAFMGFSSADPLGISFKIVEPFRADPGTGSGSGGTTTGATGCKQLASFKTNAQPGLQANCASCHGGGDPNAKSAMDLTNINAADDPTLLLACNQVLTRINTTDVENSGFFIAPKPGDGTNHPFKFNPLALYTTFHDAVVIWANAEKTSP